ncbi:MAG: tRNA (adenosine(37)-N6)-dimethylallyltransferase MiaA [Bacteroidetes bacterium GWA2_30_7]|nr:MAG: tRNA (adenosine(37)-N6)-dimethylallyltransferase MiaA [Bacteroidetes bacterium GWA2_30_7]
MSKYNLITILGPTASGKTQVASNLAFALNAEVISADSRQVYKNMNLGTGKDYDDYIVNGKQIPYHLIDIHEAGYKYNVFEYQKDFIKVFNQLQARNILPILCGGTGMYLEAVLKGYKLLEVPPDIKLREELESKSMDELIDILKSLKKTHNVNDFDTKKRAIRAIEIEKFTLKNDDNKVPFPKINPLIIGVKYNRETQRSRITQRLKQRLESGMLDEVHTLLKSGIAPDTLIYYGLEYKFITLHLTGKLTHDEMFTQLNTAIHQFAKRQMTWFRRMEKNGFNIHWIDGEIAVEKKIDVIIKLM